MEVVMSNPVIFKELPATFPEKDRYQKPSFLSALVFHAVLIVALVFIPVMFPQHIDPWVTTLLVAPLPPPPAPAPPAPAPVDAAASKPVEPKIVKVVQVDPGAIVSPIVIPKDITIVVDDPIAATSGVVGGVPGGVPGGVVGGIFGGILAANAKPTEVIPPPPPPPPPATPEALRRQPIRVGGMVQEPKIVKLVPPVYPVLAQKARVSGTVVLEAVLTADGSVDEIRVISGHPLLINAAIECVKQWKYEPSYLNGEPVAVILTARVSFYQKITL
jgi:protein TonB